MHEAIRRVVASTLGLPAADVSEGASMSNCAAWDSLRHFEVILAIERDFQVRFPMDVIPELTSVARLAEQLAVVSATGAQGSHLDPPDAAPAQTAKGLR